MDIDDTTSKRARGRGRARARARGRGRGTRARGRGKKAAARIVSSDEEISQENPEEIVPAIQLPINPLPAIQTADAVEDVTSNKENEIKTPPEEILPPTIDMEADISQLEAPTFTTISRGPPEPMLRLKWDHKVSLIGEKVLNPMIHCCDECEKPILVYGRMIPCKHIFCLKCARAEPIKLCPRCKDKVLRVEQSGLGTVFMCTHGGSRYGNTGCRRTYLSQRDLQAHINHRHVTPQVNADNTVIKSTQLMDKSINMPQRKSTEPSTISTSGSSSATGTIGSITCGIIGPASRPQQRSSQQQQQFGGSNISVGQSASLISSRANLINVPLQEAGQQSMGKLNLQQSSSSGLNQQQSMHSHHVSEALAAASYYSTSLQSYVSPSSGTYSAPTVQTVMTQNYGTIPSVQPQSGGNNSVMSGVMSSQSVIHNMQLASQAHLNSRSSNVPPLPAPPPPQAPAYYSPYGQHYGQMPHYQYDQNYPGNTQNSQWNQQQYYR